MSGMNIRNNSPACRGMSKSLGSGHHFLCRRLSMYRFPLLHVPVFGFLILALVAITFALAPSAAFAQAIPAPETAVVAKLQDGLIDIMKDPPAGGAEAKSDALSELVASTFDIDSMGEVAVGTRIYQRWSGFQRQEFLGAFARFMIATHSLRFEDAKEQSFVIDSSDETQSRRKLVHARYLRAEREPVAIDYLVQPTRDGWRILDVYLDGTVSLLALHRSEFSSVLRDRGFDGFIAAMHAKADELAARPTN